MRMKRVQLFCILYFALILLLPLKAFAAPLGGVIMQEDYSTGVSSDVPGVIDADYISVDGDFSTGAHASGEAVINIAKYIIVSGEISIAAEAISGGSVNVSGDVSAFREMTKAAYAVDRGSIGIDGGILALGDEVYGLDIQESSRANVSGDVFVSGVTSIGAHAYDNSNIDIGGNVSAKGGHSNGLQIWENSTANVSGNIFASGEDTKGAYVVGESAIDIGGSISVVGQSTFGLLAMGSTAQVSGGVSVSGDYSGGVDLYVFSTASIDKNVTVEGEGSHGLWVYESTASISGDLYVSGDSSMGADVYLSAVLNISGDVLISGDNATGLYSNANANIYVKGDSVEVYGEDSTALKVDWKGNISFDNTLVWAEENLLSTDSGGSVNAGNGSRLYGKVTNMNDAYAGDELYINLTGGSSLEGAVNDTGAEAVTNITISDLNDIWRVAGSSAINGTLTNSGTVDFTSSSGYTNVRVENLSGGTAALPGTFVMKSDISQELADRLNVKGTTSGSYMIEVINNGSAATTGEEITLLVETKDRGGDFALTHDVEAGAWLYGLRQNTSGYGSGAGWELYAKGMSGPGEAALSTLMGSYLLSYAETTFIQRMGDLRSSPQLAGLWARTYGGQFEGNPSWHTPDLFDMDFWGVNIGYDRKVDISWEGDAYYGAFFGYSRGDMGYASGGSGNIDSTMVGLYGAYVSPGGFYLDSVLKYRWRKSDFSTYDSSNTLVESDKVRTHGFGWSLEMGQRISFNGTPKSGWYAEPQVQLRYQRHNDGYFNLSNGLRIGTEGFTSIIGRLGILAGYETEDRNYYVKAFRLKEFKGDLNVYANGTPIREDLGDSWWVYGLGFTAKVNDRNSMYLDLERTSGNDIFEQKWRLNAGWRMVF